ncbi:craniofacial development protein 2-like [Schistocerca cancellata]|uniref:craniofacial development protein 2-like n=1 Tax=Schistocerca cancellata TaxID=274614 RepID=UPI002119A1D8|nr:craniofacial development protein 2-like [Schistocerca cancellata]
MDVVILSETKKKGQGEEELDNYVHTWSGVSKAARAKAGVSIMIKKSWKKRITNWTFINQRIITVEMTLFAREVVIIGVYAPTNDTKDKEKDTLWDTLRETIEKIPRRKELIIMGDLNGGVGIRESSRIVGKHGEDEYNDNGERLIAFCEQFDLKITNTFFKHKDIHKYTWQQNTKELRSIIDYIIIRQTSSFKAVDVRSYRGAQCGSDHYLVKMKSFWPWKNARSDTSNINKTNQTEKDESLPFNIDSLQDESIRTLFAARMERKLVESFEGSTEEIYDYIKANVKIIATEVLGKKDSNHNRAAEWWSEEVEVLVREKRNAFLQWLNDKSEETRSIYKEKKNEVMNKIRMAKNEAWERTCAKGDGRPDNRWRFIRVWMEANKVLLQKAENKA